MIIYPADVVDAHESRESFVHMAAYLQSRFFPPLPADYAHAALAAIQLVNMGDDDSDLILPNPINPRPREAYEIAGTIGIKPRDLVSALRLNHMIDTESEEV